mmetsp:Transcript_5109/g.17772  ORF Transcript_5109/g.17772 Transcript_5109/m.17772 type:complete len:228 (+) Transcript_5109:191-874(+)
MRVAPRFPISSVRTKPGGSPSCASSAITAKRSANASCPFGRVPAGSGSVHPSSSANAVASATHSRSCKLPIQRGPESVTEVLPQSLHSQQPMRAADSPHECPQSKQCARYPISESCQRFERSTRRSARNTGPCGAYSDASGVRRYPHAAPSRTAAPMSMRSPCSFAHGIERVYAPYERSASAGLRPPVARPSVVVTKTSPYGCVRTAWMAGASVLPALPNVSMSTKS